MGEVRGTSARICAAALVMMVTIMPLLFHYCECEPKGYTVGDSVLRSSLGWAPGLNYTKWLEGKTFHVNDTIYFNFDQTKHNLATVSNSHYKSCVADSNEIHHARTGGKEHINLVNKGLYSWISTFKGDCRKGMKLQITAK